MDLSPHEERILATLEAELRADDPALAATLDEPPAGPASPDVVSPRTALVLLGTLVAALLGLVAASALLGDRLGSGGTAALTAALVGAWLVAATWWMQRESRARARRPARPAGPGARWHPRHAVGAAGAALAAVTLLPTPGLALLGLVVLSVALPWVFLRAVTWIERSGTERRDQR